MIACLFMKSDFNGNIVFVSFRFVFFFPKIIGIFDFRYRLHEYYHLISTIKKKTPRLEVHKEFLKFAVLNQNSYGAFSLTWPASVCKFIGTKESVYIRKEFNSHRTASEHQHGRHFIVLEHQYGRRDVM